MGIKKDISDLLSVSPYYRLVFPGGSEKSLEAKNDREAVGKARRVLEQKGWKIRDAAALPPKWLEEGMREYDFVRGWTVAGGDRAYLFRYQAA
jgi:hypothetical protein